MNRRNFMKMIGMEALSLYLLPAFKANAAVGTEATSEDNEDDPSDVVCKIIYHVYNTDMYQEENVITEDNRSDDIMLTDFGEGYTEFGPYYYPVAEGYPTQPAGGTTFGSSGGSIGYSTEGGPSVNISVSVSAPFNSISFSVGLGITASSGVSYNFNVPGAGTYKLYILKTYKVRPYVVYTRTTSAEPWSISYKGYSKALYNIEGLIVRC